MAKTADSQRLRKRVVTYLGPDTIAILDIIGGRGKRSATVRKAVEQYIDSYIEGTKCR